MILNYYYNSQLKKCIEAFSNIFTGLQVKTGQNADGEIDTINVPIFYGSRDRVVSALAASHTQNKQYSLPLMSCYMLSLVQAPERQHGVNQVDRRRHLKAGGVFPDEVQAVTRVMPIPYNMQMELALHVSNTDQLFQVLEQILILFDYDMQLELNDAAFDWARISRVVLTGLNNEEVYPLGIERRSITWTMTFDLEMWLSPPLEVRNDIIKAIKLRIGSMEGFVLNEIGPDGEVSHFVEPE